MNKELRKDTQNMYKLLLYPDSPVNTSSAKRNHPGKLCSAVLLCRLSHQEKPWSFGQTLVKQS